jgi:catechol 2,3-dioxygenase-like lactoylglutathione lyase family enzyme
MEAMVAFYAEAFGAVFRTVQSGSFDCHFGKIGDLTIKLVPLRESVDFDGYPDHQLGFAVGDVERIIEIAEKHGGCREGEVLRQDGTVHGSVRDPDGNTLELYG